jgi:hypothetical protein
MSTFHDATHQSNLLREALQSDKVRIGFLLGAGCPLGIFDSKEESSLKHIPDVSGLTKAVCEQLETSDDKRTVKLGPIWKKMCEACVDDILTSPTVEHLLTEIRTLCARRGKTDVDGIGKETLQSLDETICDLISEQVGKALPAHRCSYHRFAAWVAGVQRLAPVEIFTPNYDLLIEEAFEQQRLPLFDGFVGAREPFFDIASIEQDAIPSRWARLWKLHGSINWQKRDDGGVFRVAGKAAQGKAMIYPSHLKYDQSRRMPYLAMIDRFRSFFRKSTHSEAFGPPVLVVCGYSFSDEHLNEVLLDGLRGNRSAQCFALLYSTLDQYKDAIDLASARPNLTLVAKDGAVVGTRLGQYKDSTSKITSDWKWLSTTPGDVGGDGTKPTTVDSLLGDFHFFCLFLEHVYGGNRNDDA